VNALIADIGGTNTRCAIAGPAGPERVRHFQNEGFTGPAALLADYLADLPRDAKPNRALLAVAGPVRGDRVQMTNRDWAFKASELGGELGLDAVAVLNDFEAQAYALPMLTPAGLIRIGAGQGDPAAPKGVLGPGTGLGVATLLPMAGGWRALPGEGGHVSLAPSTDREEQVISDARRRFGHCSAERLISGPGLSLLHELLHGERNIPAAELGERVGAQEPRALASFGMFCELLGTVAGNLALTVGALGGIYIAGGILPRHAGAFAASGFRARFEAKGRYAGYLASIPTLLITAAEPGLTGLAYRASLGT
jgi:glucokinase